MPHHQSCVIGVCCLAIRKVTALTLDMFLKNSRVVKPEILDHLAPDDPTAQRSRRDLQRINWMMDNEVRIINAVHSYQTSAEKGIVEIGAGDGTLMNRLAEKFPTAPLSAYDLAPRPEPLAKRVDWHRGDILASTNDISGGVLIANLFLHHFEPPALIQLGQLCGGFEVLVFNEPNRARLSHIIGLLSGLFFNHVTRHDMHVSIKAGFQTGELQELLGLNLRRWQIRETSSWRGTRTVLAGRL